MPSSPNGPCRTGKATSAPSRPAAGRSVDLPRRRASSAPSREIVTSTTSWPASRRPVGDRRAGAQRDVVLAGAAAARGRRPSPAPPFFRVGRLARRRLADRRSVTVSPGSSSAPGRRELVGDPADLRLDVGLLLLSRSTLEAGVAQRLRPRRGAACRPRSAPCTFSPRWRRRSRPSSRLRPRLPALGDWSITWPAGASFSCFADARATGRGRGSAAPRAARWPPTTTGTVTSFGPRGDDQDDGRSAGSRSAAGGSEPITVALLDRVRVARLDRGRRSPPLRSFSSPPRRSGPRPGTLARARGRRSRSASTWASSRRSSGRRSPARPRRRRRRVLLEHRGRAGASRSTRLISPTSKPFCSSSWRSRR